MVKYNRSGRFARQGFPKEIHQIFHYRDQIQQSMTIHNGILYCVEGKNYNDSDSPPRRKNVSYNYGNTPRRTRTNFLTAYNIETGQFVWRFPSLDLFDDPAAPKKKKMRLTKRPTMTPKSDLWVRRSVMAICCWFRSTSVAPSGFTHSMPKMVARESGSRFCVMNLQPAQTRLRQS